MSNPFPSDPIVTRWLTIYIDVEKAAAALGFLLPQAAVVATDMKLLEPLVPYLIKIAETGRPVQPGDPVYEHPAGNPDAMQSGSDNVSGP